MTDLQQSHNDSTHPQPAASIDLLRSLNSHLITLREEEHRALTRRIHDDMSQSLTVIQMELSILESRIPLTSDTAEHFTNIKKMASKLIYTAKDLIYEHRPPILDDFGIVAGLEWLASRFHSSAGFECMVTAEPKEINLSSVCKTAIYRIAEEALLNTARHASAHNVSVLLTESSEDIRLVISDDGDGFVQQFETDIEAGKFGLLQMREHVAYLGGEITINSSPGPGTSIDVLIPALPGNSL